MEQNKKDIAISFLKLASSGKVNEAFSKYVGVKFRHHNPYFEGFAEPLLMAMQADARQNPNKALDVKRSIAEGDLVVIHSQVRQNPADSGAAVVHIFRLEENYIVELWDVGQAVSEKSPNQYGMF